MTDRSTDWRILGRRGVLAGIGSLMGSTFFRSRAWADPSTSVVNKYSQVWDVPNLFVVGAANFPQNAGYNPTGTVGALAYNTADAIISRYLNSPGPLA